MFFFNFYHGNSKACQQAASMDNCLALIGISFGTALDKKNPYSSVSVGSNASHFTKRWARYHARVLQSTLKSELLGNDGLLIGGLDGSQEEELVYASIPALIAVPFYKSHTSFSKVKESDTFQTLIAGTFATSILETFPNGGLIGFNISSGSNNNYNISDIRLHDSILQKTSDILLSANGYIAPEDRVKKSIIV